MKNKKIWVALAVFLVAIAVFVGVYYATRPQTQPGSKSYTVTVVHADGSTQKFSYRTDEEYLDKALLAEGLISGTEKAYGLVIEVVDGEAAMWEDGAYWSLYIGEEYSMTGISSTPVYDGSAFKLIYEVFSES